MIETPANHVLALYNARVLLTAPAYFVVVYLPDETTNGYHCALVPAENSRQALIMQAIFGYAEDVSIGNLSLHKKNGQWEK